MKFFKLFKWDSIREEGYNESIELVKKKFRNNIIYDGYFQSEDFFENVVNTVKKNFIIKKKFIHLFEQKYYSTFKENKILAIHCRIGDYVNWGNDRLGGKNLVLPKNYFINAYNQITDIENYKVIIVTDDIENATDFFDFIKIKSIVSENEIIDFQIILNADKIIISNSTFSWWAAYLNKKNPIVYAPEYFVGFKIKKEFPIGIIPKKFNKINF